MTESVVTEGRYGRTAVLRLKPNVDLIHGLERACKENGVSQAVVRSALGSLTDASFDLGDSGRTAFVEGPGLEIVTLTGEIRPGEEGAVVADLAGSVVDRDGRLAGGRFRRGENPICITLELVLQEWTPEAG